MVNMLKIPKNVYYYGNIINGAETKSFTVLRGDAYAKDTYNVY